MFKRIETPHWIKNSIRERDIERALLLEDSQEDFGRKRTVAKKISDLEASTQNLGEGNNKLSKASKIQTQALIKELKAEVAAEKDHEARTLEAYYSDEGRDFPLIHVSFTCHPSQLIEERESTVSLSIRCMKDKVSNWENSQLPREVMEDFFNLTNQALSRSGV